jgi:hypothetical protein
MAESQKEKKIDKVNGVFSQKSIGYKCRHLQTDASYKKIVSIYLQKINFTINSF